MEDTKSTTPQKLSDGIENTVANIIAGSKTPEQYCIDAGIDLLDIYRTLGDIAQNAELMSKDKYGDPVSLGADNRSRMAAIALILELNKHIKDKSVVTQVGIFNDPRVIDETNRVLALRDKLVDETNKAFATRDKI